MIATSDFETTTKEDDCRVWAWGVVDINNPNRYIQGNCIETFIDYCKNRSRNNTLYFHNLKFDAEFIIAWLLSHDFKWIKERKDAESKTFTTLISDKGQFYSMEIFFEKRGHKTNKVTIYDSLKIIPLSIDEIAKGFHLPEQKLKIDYTAHREPGHEITGEESLYLRHDCTIAAKALKSFFDQGLDRMTQGSNALADYKNIIGQKKFKRWFPVPTYRRHMDMKPAYKGGFTYLNPKFKGKDVGCGIVLDVNSLYPSVMYYEMLPYGEPVYFEGEYQYDEVYPLYIQRIRCHFELMENHIPTIQIKGSGYFVPTEYLTSSDGEDVVLTLTNVDLKLFFEHYDVFNIEYLGGYKFKGQVGMFKEYIDKWSNIKIQSKKEHNHAMYILAKLMLNALYGKFALNPDVASKEPILVDGHVEYKLPTEEYIGTDGKVRRRVKYDQREPIYIPMGIFITSWARNKTIRAAQSVYDRFVYADTDSLHLIGLEIPSALDIDSTRLGAWDHEATFVRARFLRAKCYIEQHVITRDEYTRHLKEMKYKESLHRLSREKLMDTYSFLKITCAGLPPKCYPQVTWDNFSYGVTYTGKLKPKHVRGGQILEETDFTILREAS